MLEDPDELNDWVAEFDVNSVQFRTLAQPAIFIAETSIAVIQRGPPGGIKCSESQPQAVVTPRLGEEPQGQVYTQCTEQHGYHHVARFHAANEDAV